jgi:hypothetical protein
MAGRERKGRRKYQSLKKCSHLVARTTIKCFLSASRIACWKHRRAEKRMTILKGRFLLVEEIDSNPQGRRSRLT